MSTMSDRSWGITALNYYRSASLLPSSLSLVDQFDMQSPGLVESFGRMARSVKNQNDLKTKMQTLAFSKGMSLPTRAELNQVFLDLGASIDTLEVLGEAASGFFDGVATLLKTVVTLAVIGGAVYLLITTTQGRKLIKAARAGMR